jgi:hypothetical protein
MGEVQDFVDIKEIADLLNYDVEEIEDLVERGQIPHHRNVEIQTDTGLKSFALGFPKQEVLSRITPRKQKPKKKKKKAEPKESPEEEEAEGTTNMKGQEEEEPF